MEGERVRALVLALGLGLLSSTPSEASPITDDLPADTATIVVTASASVSVTPDRARLRFAIETQAGSAAEATAANAEITEAAIASLRPFVGDDGSLATSSFAVGPIYGSDGSRSVVGFRTSNALVVVLDDLDAVGRAIDAAIDAGANRVDGLTFFAADTETAYLEALTRATSRARREAQVLASASGADLGRIVSLQSTGSGRPTPVMMAESFARADTPIEPGDQSIGASVRLEIQLLGR